MEKMENANFTPPDPILIRPAVQQDIEMVHGFLSELEEMHLDFNRFQEVYTHNLTNPMIHYLVAERNGEVVGFVSCHGQYLLHHTGKVGEIQELFVKPAHRNQQIGHQLLAALEALAIQEGFVNLEVTTNQKRLDTIRFYEREAFNRTHFKLVKQIQP